MARTQNDAKRLVGQTVADMITAGMVLGLGTGSTAAMAIKALGERISREGLEVKGIPTSFASERLARENGIPLTTLDEHPAVDLAFDGADEFDPGLALIKGRGAAHTREKIVAAQARSFVVLVDESKRVSRLGERMPLPVEVVPMAVAPVMTVLRKLGGDPVLRMGVKKDGPVVTDQGLWILDAAFDHGMGDLDAVNMTLLQTPGVLDHGLFLDMATTVLVGRDDGTVERLDRR
ncbi:MAG: ribose 5-phosphate isomerase A [Rhodothermales bacterium]